MPSPVLMRRLSASRTVKVTDFSLLSGWWKADSFALADSTAVGGTGKTWLDLSGGGRDMAQATAGSQPLFRTAQFGNLPAIQFDGTKWWSFTSLSIPGDFTIIAVVKQDSGNDGMVMSNQTTNHQVRLNTLAGNKASMFFNGGSGVNSSAFATSQTSKRMIAWRRTGSTGTFRENNTAIAGLGGFVETGTIDAMSKFNNQTAVDMYSGLIGEIIIYKAYRTDAECSLLYTGYLKTRWGLP